MASAQDIADWLVATFDPSSVCKLDVAIERVLRIKGYSRFAAASEAIVNLKKVHLELQSRRSESLPFEFGKTDALRLVGKRRDRRDDNSTTKAVRQCLSLVPDMLEAVFNLGDLKFEKICAKIMLLSGATEAVAICSGDDGGIDVYGRIPLRERAVGMADGLLETSLLNKSYVFFGQCKCYEPQFRIGRPEIERFEGGLSHCLRQYEGNKYPPSNRVPSTYYRKHETCVRIFFTTADYTDTAVGAAASLDIILIDGRRLAEFLVYHKVAVTERGAAHFSIDEDKLASWAVMDQAANI